MKKGVSSQVFIYIFVVIVIAFIMFFGFKQIVNLKNLTEKSVYVVFKSDFSEAVNDVYYMNKGSTLVFSKESRNKPLTLPKDIKGVCFQEDKIILDSNNYDDFTVNNLFGNECINVVNGLLSFKLENIVENQEVMVKVSNMGTE